MSAIMLAIVISRQMTIGPKNYQGLKIITSFKIDPQFYLQAERKIHSENGTSRTPIYGS